MRNQASKIRQAEESIARFEADVERYRRTADAKEQAAAKWRRYLRRLKAATPVKETAVVA